MHQAQRPTWKHKSTADPMTWAEYQNKNFLQNRGVALYEMNNNTPYVDRTAILIENTPLGDVVMVRRSDTYWESIPSIVREKLGASSVDRKIPYRTRRERNRHVEIWVDGSSKPYNVWIDSWRGDFFKRAFVDMMQALTTPKMLKEAMSGGLDVESLYEALFNLTHASNILCKGEK